MGEKHRCMRDRYIDRLVASRTPPTQDLVHKPRTCSDRESDQRPLPSSQVGTQSTEPHQPELKYFNINGGNDV